MRKTRKIIWSILAGLVLIVVLATPVLAAAYYADVFALNSSGTSYTMLPLMCDFPTEYLATNGYMSGTGLDTLLENGVIPHMLSDGKLLFAKAMPAGSSSLSEFTTGNTPISSFYVIPGYGGYITTLDDPWLEFGTNFTVDMKGYLDMAMTDEYLADKTATFRVYPGWGDLVYAEICGGGQPIVGGYNDTLNPAATEYNSLMGGYTWDAAESNRYQCIPTGGTISELYVRLSANVGAGATYTFTLMVDSVASALAVTIPAGASTGSDLTHVVNVVAGQTVSFRSTRTGAPGAPMAQWATHWNGTIANESICLINMTSSLGATMYGEIQGAVGIGSVTETQVQAPIPSVSGTFSKLYVKLSADPGDPAGPDGYSFTLMKGGVAQPLTCTITADNTTGNDIVNTASFVAGNLADIRIAPLNVPAVAPICAVGMVFTSFISGESLIMGGSWADQPTINATEYNNLCGAGNGVWAAAEASAYSLIQETLLKRLYVKLDAAPGGVTSYTVSIREGVGNTGLTVTITGAATTGNDVINTYISSVGDVADTRCITTAGAAAARVHWGLVCQNMLVQTFTAAPVTTGIRRVVAAADGINLTVSVYDAGGGLLTSGSTALGSATVPDTAQFWFIDQGNVMPYMDYLKITTAIGGVSEKLYYQPVDYIHGQPYSTGTAWFVNGFDSVNGTGTAWTSAMEGSVIWSDIDRISYTVLSVESATLLYLTTPYMGAGGMGHTYTMLPRLPDRDIVDGSQDGAITWGVNPAGVSVYADALAAIATGGGEITPPPPDVAPVVSPPTGMFPSEEEQSGQALTWFYPIVSDTAQQTNTPIVMIWYLFCAVFVLLFMAAIHRFVPNMLLTGVGGLVALGACVAMAFLPSWFIILVTLLIVGLLVAERSPSV